jgi:hypothetical protein
MRGFRYLLVVVPVAALLVAAGPALAAQRYTVRWGDTLTGIASAHGVSLHHLARANHIRPRSLLLAGTTLRIPARNGSPAPTASGAVGRHLSASPPPRPTITHLAAINGISPFGVLLAGSHLRVRVPRPPRHAAGGSFDAVACSTGGRPTTASIRGWRGRSPGWNPATHRRRLRSAPGVMQVMPATWRFTERLIGHPVARTPDGTSASAWPTCTTC